MEQKKYDLKTVNGFSATIVNYKNSIGKFLNPRYGITPEDFIETCIRAVKENPKLLQCDPKSLFGAVLLSAEVGLKPNTSLQHSFIIPYKGQAKFQIGYKGLIEIMYRNPRVKQITARAVFENDDFDYGYGLKPYLNHKPARKDKGKLECVYATCLVDDEPIFVVIERAELDAIRGFSQTIESAYSPYNNGTDVHNWMEIKAGIKALSKVIPTSNNVDMAKAVEYDSKFQGGARVLVEIPTNPNDIVEPKLVDSNLMTNTFDTAFDIVEDNVEEEKKVEIEQPIIIKEEPTIVKEQIIPIVKEVVIEENQVVEQFKEPIKEHLKPIKEHSVSENQTIEFELPISEDDFESDDDDDNDIRFDFPDGEDDDDDEIPSTLF
jgi:recombination protein RecT